MYARRWVWYSGPCWYSRPLMAGLTSTPEEMDDALFGVWRRVVDPGDTVVILGDVAIGGLSGRRLKRFRVAPGRKVLVLGNHEFDGTVAGHLEGFDGVYSTVYVPGSPELLLTHVPLRDVPEGCVNVHGHLHKWVPSGTRHINVVVEQTRYRPRSLTAVRRLAAFLVRGGIRLCKATFYRDIDPSLPTIPDEQEGDTRVTAQGSVKRDGSELSDMTLTVHGNDGKVSGVTHLKRGETKATIEQNLHVEVRPVPYIFCASRMPSSPDEAAALKRAFGDEYDTWYTIKDTDALTN